MPVADTASPNGLLAAGGDLAPGTVLAAYRTGIFPWPDQMGRLLWWSPDPRAIIEIADFHESRSLVRRRQSGRFTTSFDRACAAVLDGCADRAEGTWLNDEMKQSYLALYKLGWVHSVEVWQGARLVGGLYGVAIGGLFAAESMFHRETDASKVALAELVGRLRRSRLQLLDVQFLTPHLASLGASEISRVAYLDRLAPAIASAVRF